MCASGCGGCGGGSAPTEPVPPQLDGGGGGAPVPMLASSATFIPPMTAPASAPRFPWWLLVAALVILSGKRGGK